MNPKFYSIKEAAEELGISKQYAYYLKDTGQIKTERIGAQYIITEKELERYKLTRNQKTEGGEQ